MPAGESSFFSTKDGQVASDGGSQLENARHALCVQVPLGRPQVIAAGRFSAAVVSRRPIPGGNDASRFRGQALEVKGTVCGGDGPFQGQQCQQQVSDSVDRIAPVLSGM